MLSIRTTTVLSAALAAVLAAAGSAAAATANPTGRPSNFTPMTAHVLASSRGLDLGSPSGAATFLERLSTAAGRACEERTSPVRMLARSEGFRACRDKAMALAMTQVRAPLVRQQYAQLRAADAVRLARR